jgi:hypothetical protein
MAIEIKELRIKVNITESSVSESNSFQKFDPVKMNEIKSEIIRECTQKVLEKIKEKAER